VSIRREDVLRYLGWRGQEIDEALERRIEEAIALCEKAATPRSVRRVFPLERGGEGIALDGSLLVLTGVSIEKFLRGATSAALFAATLGQELDLLLRRLSFTDIPLAALADAAATALIESTCDEVEAAIYRENAQENCCVGHRFSPGYGDLPLALQPPLLAALNAERAIGLTCTPQFLMIPGKSVTAVVGLGDASGGVGKGCDWCDRGESCPYKNNREGTP
jgi:hypothetical protein